MNLKVNCKYKFACFICNSITVYKVIEIKDDIHYIEFIKRGCICTPKYKTIHALSYIYQV